MKHFFPLLVLLLAIVGCSKDDDASASCCSDTDYRIESPHRNLLFFAPNVITPNGDARNDAFVIGAIDTTTSSRALVVFTSSRLTLYRRGTSVPVFQSTNYQNTFDGHATNGSQLADGLYYYEAVLDDNSIRGDVYIARRKVDCLCRAIDISDPLLGY